MASHLLELHAAAGASEPDASASAGGALDEQGTDPGGASGGEGTGPGTGSEPESIFDAIESQPPEPLPFRSEMETRFRRDLSHVRAFTGQATPMARLGAGGMARGDAIVFADERPSPDLVAHEVTHVLQGVARVHFEGRPDQGDATREEQAEEAADSDRAVLTTAELMRIGELEESSMGLQITYQPSQLIGQKGKEVQIAACARVLVNYADMGEATALATARGVPGDLWSGDLPPGELTEAVERFDVLKIRLHYPGLRSLAARARQAGSVSQEMDELVEEAAVSWFYSAVFSAMANRYGGAIMQELQRQDGQDDDDGDSDYARLASLLEVSQGNVDNFVRFMRSQGDAVPGAREIAELVRLVDPAHGIKPWQDGLEADTLRVLDGIAVPLAVAYLKWARKEIMGAIDAITEADPKKPVDAGIDTTNGTAFAYFVARYANTASMNPAPQIGDVRGGDRVVLQLEGYKHHAQIIYVSGNHICYQNGWEGQPGDGRIYYLHSETARAAMTGAIFSSIAESTAGMKIMAGYMLQFVGALYPPAGAVIFLASMANVATQVGTHWDEIEAAWAKYCEFWAAVEAYDPALKEALHDFFYAWLGEMVEESAASALFSPDFGTVMSAVIMIIRLAASRGAAAAELTKNAAKMGIELGGKVVKSSSRLVRLVKWCGGKIKGVFTDPKGFKFIGDTLRVVQFNAKEAKNEAAQNAIDALIDQLEDEYTDQTGREEWKEIVANLPTDEETLLQLAEDLTELVGAGEEVVTAFRQMSL